MNVINVVVLCLANLGAFLQFAEAARQSIRRNDLIYVPPILQSGYSVPLQGGLTCLGSNGCSSTLPLPPAQQNLTYLTLARGFSNYSCAERKPTESPVFKSQDTTLWDAAPLLPQIPSEELFHTLIKQLYEFDYTALKNSSLTCIGSVSWINYETIFDIFGVATFPAHIQNSVNAPEDPAMNTQWAYWNSFDLTWTVYRVETVGGTAPPTCNGQNDNIRVDYAAEYWFYHL